MEDIVKKLYSKETLKIVLKEVETIDYQVEMINSNNSLVNIEKNIFNKDIELNYNILELTSIKDYLKTKKISKSQLINIFEQVFNLINNCSNYLLCKENLLINSEDIFLEKESLNVKLIYIPTKNREQDINGNFKKFIKEVIVDLAIIEDTEEDNFVQILLNFVKDDSLTINDFSDILSNLKKATKKSSNKIDLNEVKATPNLLSKDKSISNMNSGNNIKKDGVNVNLKSHDLQSQPQPKSQSQPQVIRKKKENDVNEKTEEEYEIKLIYKPIRKIIAIVLQVFFIIMLAVAISFIGKTEMSQVATGILLVIILDVLAIRILLDKEKMIKVKVKTNKNKSKKEDDKKVNKPMNLKKKQITNENFDNNIAEYSSDTEIIDSSETTLLDNNPYFILNRDGISEKIDINKDVFVIGRMPNVADYAINNSAIGRTHIQILKKNNEVYLRDLKSKNGTFVNGQRIVDGEILLKNNDKVTIANVDMIFKDM
ncbi:MAG: DUF6382 domain-containing protein [Clostridium sp.]|nr:DUF6382 domain-containing protein [Clostridium sp.]